jgi:spermidine synthase
LLNHNGIAHGAQFMGKDQRRTPTSYYAYPAGVAILMNQFHPERPRKIGLVGLGSGVMAAHGKAGDALRFYELDPEVVTVARTQFTFLADTPAKVDVVVGDARLSLARESDEHFDVLVLDAFAGDSVPVHLLTVEAFALYLRHLERGGVLAVHTSNRHLDLVSPVAAAAKHFGLNAACFSTTALSTPHPSEWILLSGDAKFINSLRTFETYRPIAARQMAPWTDNHAALFPLLR